VGLVITNVVAFAVVHSLVRSQERRLLEERATEAGLVASGFFNSIESELPLLAVTTDPRPGATDAFDRAANVVGGGFGATGGLLVADGGDVTPFTETAVDVVSEERADLARSAIDDDGMVTAILDEPGGAQLSFAVPVGDGRVLYRDIPLALLQGVDMGDDGPFSELDAILYAGPTDDPASRVFSSGVDELSGTTARSEVSVGEDEWLLVASANEPLVGSFAGQARWAVLAIGLVASALAGVLVELMSRRRRYALALVEVRTAELNEALRELEELAQSERHAREEAESANQAKAEFISRMSHELRTPLNAVIGFGQLLELDDLEADQADSVQQIVKGGRHLLGLINEILDISRIDSGTLALSSEPVELAPLVEESMTLLRPLASKDDVTLVHAVPAGLHVCADRQRLKQIVLNLVANAVKYNVHGGSVTVAGVTDTGDGRVQLVVADTGRGIDAAHLDKLFVPFERLGAERSTVEGTGMGLALSRRLAEAMNGTLSVESAVGAGSRFTLDLPAADDPLATTTDGALESPPATEATERRHVVLYIEDNLSNIRLVERILARRSDVELIPAMQGRMGVELAREHRPALILLDLHLPDMNGDEVLRHLRRDPATATAPVCIVSADASQGQIDRLLAGGADAYLTKPIDVAELLRLTSSAIDARLAV
jgi:signal transduction histidine kinase/ActR/RegA family two-component response regulator